MLDTKDELLTVKEAAKLLKVTPHTIYRWIAQGRLPAMRYSSRVVRIPRSAVADVHEKSSDAGGTPPKGSPQALLRFAGIIAKAEADELWRVIRNDREASINDPH